MNRVSVAGNSTATASGVLFAGLLFVLAWFSFPDVLSAAAADSLELNQRIDRILARYKQLPENWGIVFRSLDNDDYLVRRNDEHGFMPASNLKLLVTAVALDQLGPDFRFRTTVMSDGGVSPGDSTLSGDLILRGSGDPAISARFFRSTTEVWDQLATKVRAAGIRHVRGSLVADNSLYQPPFLANGWSWEDLNWWYAAPASALSYNDNVVDLTALPASNTGEPPVIRITPSSSTVNVINRATTVSDRSGDHLVIARDTPGGALTLSGGIYRGSIGYMERVAVDSPGLFAASAFLDALARKGIRVDGPVKLVQSPEESEAVMSRAPAIVAQHESVPLAEIVRVINKRSHNFYAEQLLFALGAYRGRGGGFRQGIEVEEKLLRKLGVNLNRIRLEDGSGLSRLNLVTPDMFIRLLTYMHSHPAAKQYFESLPVSGVDNGVRMMHRTAADGKIHAKTGYIASVMALSGYACTLDGEPLVFSVIGNNWLISKTAARMVIRDICVEVSQFRRGWKPAPVEREKEKSSAE